MKQNAPIVIFAMLSGSAYADGCAKPRNAFDNVYCAGALFSQVDRGQCLLHAERLEAIPTAP
jgi:hypothetical protein